MGKNTKKAMTFMLSAAFILGTCLYSFAETPSSTAASATAVTAQNKENDNLMKSNHLQTYNATGNDAMLIRAWYDENGKLITCRVSQNNSELTEEDLDLTNAAYSKIYRFSSFDELSPLNTPISAPVKAINVYKNGSSASDAKQVTVNALGDSITYGVGSGSTLESFDYKPYHFCWGDDYKITANNFGQSGSHVAAYDTPKGYQPNNSTPFVKRVAAMSNNSPDIVTIMGGVNDCQSGYYTQEEFGSLTDKAQKDINTFCGALRTMLEELQTKYPNAVIVYLTPLKYSGKADGLGAPWENTTDLPNYINAIKIICDDYHVPVIDCYAPDTLHFCDNTSDVLIYGDRLHFGRSAHKFLSAYIMEQMEAMHIINIID